MPFTFPGPTCSPPTHRPRRGSGAWKAAACSLSTPSGAAPPLPFAVPSAAVPPASVSRAPSPSSPRLAQLSSGSRQPGCLEDLFGGASDWVGDPAKPALSPRYTPDLRGSPPRSSDPWVWQILLKVSSRRTLQGFQLATWKKVTFFWAKEIIGGTLPVFTATLGWHEPQLLWEGCGTWGWVARPKLALTKEFWVGFLDESAEEGRLLQEPWRVGCSAGWGWGVAEDAFGSADTASGSRGLWEAGAARRHGSWQASSRISGIVHVSGDAVWGTIPRKPFLTSPAVWGAPSVPQPPCSPLVALPVLQWHSLLMCLFPPLNCELRRATNHAVWPQPSTPSPGPCWHRVGLIRWMRENESLENLKLL